MNVKREMLWTIPVLPSADIIRDIAWYKEMAGFEPIHFDKMYAVIQRDQICLHLQWHANTNDDPLLGGSVIRIVVKSIIPLLEEFMQRGTVIKENFVEKTAWGTNEFGFFDLNRNVIFIMEALN